MPRPMPLAAPVITAVLPSRDFMRRAPSTTPLRGAVPLPRFAGQEPSSSTVAKTTGEVARRAERDVTEGAHGKRRTLAVLHRMVIGVHSNRR